MTTPNLLNQPIAEVDPEIAAALDVPPSAPAIVVRTPITISPQARLDAPAVLSIVAAHRARGPPLIS